MAGGGGHLARFTARHEARPGRAGPRRGDGAGLLCVRSAASRGRHVRYVAVTRYPHREHSRAVLIGVAQYEHSHLPAIPAAINNLADIRDLLTDCDNGTLDPENCRVVADPVSSALVGAILEQATEQADDVLLVYYTGHGVVDRRGRLHLGLTGTDPCRPGWTALPFDTLREAILDSPAQHSVLILDCCFSGRAFEAMGPGSDELGQIEVRGTYTIASSAAYESSFAPSGQRNTAFTGALLAAAGQNPGATLEELFEGTRRLLRGSGHPQPRRRSVNGTDRLALNTPPPTASLLERSLSERTRTLGPDHPDTLLAGHRLARAYQDENRLEDAAGLFEYILTARERVLTETDSATLATCHCLASVYHEAGRLIEAIDLYERTLHRRESVLSVDHPDITATRTGLAGVYLAAGRVTAAVSLFESLSSDRERLLGALHPDTLATRHCLAASYLEAGRVDTATALLETTLADREKVLGLDHPDTLNTWHDIASAYQEAGRVLEAIAVYERTAADREQSLGAEHPDTLTTRHDLAAAYQAAGRLGDATELIQQTLATREQILGDTHPDTLATRHSLAHAKKESGQIRTAITLLEELLAVRESLTSEDPPDPLLHPRRPRLRLPGGGPTRRRGRTLHPHPDRPRTCTGTEPSRHPRLPHRPRGHAPPRRPTDRSDQSLRTQPAGV